jgi:hypothetical protein
VHGNVRRIRALGIEDEWTIDPSRDDGHKPRQQEERDSDRRDPLHADDKHEQKESEGDINRMKLGSREMGQNKVAAFMRSR